MGNQWNRLSLKHKLNKEAESKDHVQEQLETVPSGFLRNKIDQKQQLSLSIHIEIPYSFLLLDGHYLRQLVSPSFQVKVHNWPLQGPCREGLSRGIHFMIGNLSWTLDLSGLKKWGKQRPATDSRKKDLEIDSYNLKEGIFLFIFSQVWSDWFDRARGCA